MPKIETPEAFARKLGEIRVTANIDDGYDGVIAIASKDIAARDAAIRDESAELLRVCGEALMAIPELMEAFEYEPDEDSCTGQSIFKAELNEDGFFIALNNVRIALAALREAGMNI